MSLFARKPPAKRNSVATATLAEPQFRWLTTGQQAVDEMLHAIEGATHSVCLEVYIFQAGDPGEKFRKALIEAVQRKVKVRVLIDAFGSISLANDFWHALTGAGGECRRFKLPGWGRFGLRDHRKLLICDDRQAFINGLNIGPEYAGDGVRQGWRDLGLHLHGGLARELAQAFDEMFFLADFPTWKQFAWKRHAIRTRHIQHEETTILLSAPGWRRNPLIRIFSRDFSDARTISILCAYFLPTGKILRSLLRAARRGAKIRLILAGRSDMMVMQMATRGLYWQLLRAGVEIYEYQPQVLHAKLVIVDNRVVYAGSANLDVRSLHLNYELMVRIEDPRLAEEATAIFEGDLVHSQRIGMEAWVRSRNWWNRLLSRLAYFLLRHLDPYLASGSWRR